MRGINTGNVGMLSHAPISTGTGLAIEKAVLDAGFPENLFRSVIVNNEGAAEIIGNTKVTAVTITGSERAGKAVASEAGQHLKKVVLELGGSDPYLILELNMTMEKQKLLKLITLTASGFLSTIQHSTPWRLSSAAMQSPVGPAPTIKTGIFVFSNISPLI